MLFGVLELMSLWLLREDLLCPFLLSWHGESLSEVVTFSMATPFVASIDIIVESHSGGLGAIAKLPDNTVAEILDFGNRFEVVSLGLKKGFCAPVSHSNLGDDLGPFGLQFALKTATHKVIKLLNKFV